MLLIITNDAIFVFRKMSHRMPVLFVGHGSPMNTIEDNEFTEGWRNIATTIQKPEAILCISAHWYTPSTMITTMENPRTIHDFYGFPSELYQQQYPAPGAPHLAERISTAINEYSVSLDESWGLDHGTWSVLKKMYPAANVPTIQLSIDYSKPLVYHYMLGRSLEFLRDEGVLIIGSGNLVHNLGAIMWNSPNAVQDWAREFEETIVESLQPINNEVLTNFEGIRDTAKKSHPTPDHYIPLLYAIGAAGDTGKLEIFNQKIIYGSLSMTSFKFE